MMIPTGALPFLKRSNEPTYATFPTKIRKPSEDGST